MDCGTLTVPARNGCGTRTTFWVAGSRTSILKSRLAAGKPRMLSVKSCMDTPLSVQRVGHRGAEGAGNAEEISRRDRWGAETIAGNIRLSDRSTIGLHA